MRNTGVYLKLSSGALAVLLLFFVAISPFSASHGLMRDVLGFVLPFLAVAAIVASAFGSFLFLYGLLLLSRTRDNFLIIGILCDATIVIFAVLALSSGGVGRL